MFSLVISIAFFVVVIDAEMQMECTTQICKIITNMEAVSNRGEELANRLGTFAYTYELPTDHLALKEVVTQLGDAMQAHSNLSIQSHLVRYQQKLKNESRKVDSPSTYLSAMTLKNQLSIVENLLGKLNISKEKVNQAIEDAVTSLNEKFETSRNATADLDEEISIVKREMCAPEFDPYAMSDCWDLLVAGNNETGVYTIYPHGIEKQVLCDMDRNGGGWTVFFLRRKQNKRVNFMQGVWKDYKNGFETPPQQYWMGNEIVHMMTSAKNYSVRLDVKSNGKWATPLEVWAEWNIFKIASEENAYRLHLDGFNTNGTMAHKHGFGFNHGANFSTVDRPGHSRSGVQGTCAEMDGAFWHHGYGTRKSGKDICTWFAPTYPSIYFNAWSTITEYATEFADDLSFKIRPSK